MVGAIVAQKRDAGSLKYRFDADNRGIPIDHFLHAGCFQKRVMKSGVLDLLGPDRLFALFLDRATCLPLGCRFHGVLRVIVGPAVSRQLPIEPAAEPAPCHNGSSSRCRSACSSEAMLEHQPRPATRLSTSLHAAMFHFGTNDRASYSSEPPERPGEPSTRRQDRA